MQTKNYTVKISPELFVQFHHWPEKYLDSWAWCFPGTDRIDQQNPIKVQQISDQEKMKQMEREIKELKRANEILRKAAAFFAQAELDRPHK